MALPFDIDVHGRLVPAGDETRRALADRAGRFELLPAAPDLLVARRTPATGAPATGPRCMLAGDLSALPVADFVNFIHAGRLTGTLLVSIGGYDRTVAFKEGEVRGAQSTAPAERIGEVASRLGFLPFEQLEELARIGRPLGKVLVDRGLLTAADLWKCLHEQVTAVFHAILTAREGLFAFQDQAEDELMGIPLAVNTQQLLMDGIRRIDEMSLFQARIPGPSAYLRRREPRRAVALQPLETRLLDLVDGRRTVADVAREGHLSEFDATKVLFHLAEAGCLEAVEEPAAVQAADPAQRLADIVQGMNAIYREVAIHLAAVHQLEPFLSAARAFLADPVNRFAPLWAGLALSRDVSIDPEKLLENLEQLRGAALSRLEPSGDAARYLFDGMRELLFFLLFQAGERLQREEDEALSADVKRRLEALGGLR